jgi:hypothetical protein
MSVGRSNRIVIDVDDVDLKRRMYSALAEDGRSLKEWFVAAATDYLETRVYARQLPLPVLRVAETTVPYGPRSSSDHVSAQSKKPSRRRSTSQQRRRGKSRS